MEEIKEVKFVSTVGDLEELKKSLPWCDIVNELELWKTGFENELKSIVNISVDSNPTSASILMHLGDINGRIKAVDYLLELPNVLIEFLKTQSESKGD